MVLEEGFVWILVAINAKSKFLVYLLKIKERLIIALPKHLFSNLKEWKFGI